MQIGFAVDNCTRLILGSILAGTETVFPQEDFLLIFF